MKRFALLFAIMLSVGSMMAQSKIDAVHLKNGGLVKGEIIEQVPGQSIKVQTKDGNIFVFQMDEVERIVKEESTMTNKGHRGLDFNIDLGYNLPTKSGSDGCPTGELSLGKRFSSSFYWGMGAGAYIPTGDGDVQIPITTEAKMYFPFGNSKISSFVSLKGGYVINTASDIHESVGTGRYRTTVDIKKSNFAVLQLMPGISFPLSGSVDFNLAAGYAHYIPVGGDADGNGSFVVRAGFGFHKNIYKEKRIIPTRNRGFQLTLEADGVNPWNIGSDKGFKSLGGNIVLGYKLNPKISLGVGYSFSSIGIEQKLSDLVYYEEYFNYQTTANGKELVSQGRNEIGRYDMDDGSSSGTMHNIFLRGQYRLNDNRFAPVLGLDMGYRMLSFDDSEEFYEKIRYHTKKMGEEWDDDFELKKSALFLNPFVGFSLRTTNNSYLEMKLGYALYGKIDGKVSEDDYHTSGWAGDYHRYSTMEQKDSKLSGLFLTIGWTHTFGSRK